MPSDVNERPDVTGWLLDADPSIRWQVMRDLTDTPAAIVASERSRADMTQFQRRGQAHGAFAADHAFGILAA